MQIRVEWRRNNEWVEIERLHLRHQGEWWMMNVKNRFAIMKCKVQFNSFTAGTGELSR